MWYICHSIRLEMIGKIREIFTRAMAALIILAAAFSVTACVDGTGSEYADYTEKEATVVHFTNAEVTYNGDDIDSKISDGWVIKLYTDMAIDEMGNLVGPGSVMQLLLNVRYEESQVANPKRLVGTYQSQSNSGDFGTGTFVWGQMTYINLPNETIERPDATFYASIAEGSTVMDADLLDDGKLEIVANEDGTYSIEGVLVGKKCRKRYFSWRGAIEPKSTVKPQVPNSLLTSDREFSSLTKAQLQDRGDCFYLGDETYRDFLIFLAEEGVSFEWGKPVGNGDVLRLELLVPWSADINDGVPAGTYSMLVRNADTSFNREDIVPYRVVAGLPNCFTAPYWSGAWYVNYVEGKWGESYARIDGGSVVVERGEDGSHRFICNLQDCSLPAYSLTADVTIGSDNLVVYK